MIIGIPVVNANCVDPDQTLCSLCDLVLNCLIFGLNWVKRVGEKSIKLMNEIYRIASNKNLTSNFRKMSRYRSSCAGPT